jgi:hypothetical protein
MLFSQLWKTVSMKGAYGMGIAQFIHHDLCSYTCPNYLSKILSENPQMSFFLLPKRETEAKLIQNFLESVY